MKRLPLALLLLLLSVPGIADEGSAAFFTDRGQKALDAGDFKEAEAQFQKALSEMTGYAPALLGLARAAKGAGDAPTAIAYLDRILDDAKTGTPGPAATEAVKAARAMLGEMDRPRLDYRDMIDDYVAKLFALCERSKVSDSQLASRCLDRILAVCPDHPGAKRERAALPATTSGHVLKAGDTPLFNGKDLAEWSSHADIWSVKDGVLVAAAGDASYLLRTLETFSGDYSVEYEARIAQETGADPIAILAFGCRGNYEIWHWGLFKKRFSLRVYQGSSQKFQDAEVVEYYQLEKPFDRAQWNLFRVDVRGNTATVSVNGEEATRHEAAAGAYDGAVALVVQHCTVEFRRVAIVKP